MGMCFKKTGCGMSFAFAFARFSVELVHRGQMVNCYGNLNAVCALLFSRVFRLFSQNTLHIILQEFFSAKLIVCMDVDIHRAKKKIDCRIKSEQLTFPSQIQSCWLLWSC